MERAVEQGPMLRRGLRGNRRLIGIMAEAAPKMPVIFVRRSAAGAKSVRITTAGLAKLEGLSKSIAEGVNKAACKESANFADLASINALSIAKPSPQI